MRAPPSALYERLGFVDLRAERSSVVSTGASQGATPPLRLLAENSPAPMYPDNLPSLSMSLIN